MIVPQLQARQNDIVAPISLTLFVWVLLMNLMDLVPVDWIPELAVLIGIPINFEPAFFPTPELTAACMVIAAGDTGGRPLELAQAFGRAIWEQERNIAEDGVCEEVARESGHDAVDLLARAQDPAMHQRYAEQSEAAIARGGFGAPSYVYKDELFWGQDRLDFLDRALKN